MKKRLISLIMAVVMVLSLCTVAFAAETTETTQATVVIPELPTDKDGNSTSTIAATPTGITNITVNGDTAVYHTDSDGVTYIRAIDNPDNNGEGGTEWALRDATVEITRTSSNVNLYLDGTQLSETGTTLTMKMDLFNKAHTLAVDTRENTFVLAAGLPEGTVSIAANDPLRMSSVTVNDTTVTENATNDGVISATNVQNPYIGNVSASGGEWTYINYKADIATTTIADRSAVSASWSLPNGATAVTKADDNTSCKIGDAQFDLDTPAPRLTVKKTVEGVELSRDYYIFATDSASFTVQFGIDFTEAKASTYYTGTTKSKVNQLFNAAKQFFGTTNGHAYGTITVNSGETVMDIMHKFAVEKGYSSEVPDGCTYISTLNGIGEFDFGPNSGWMYTDYPTWDGNGAALYTSWNTPPIGAASYTLSEGDTICWFICCDYTHHPWN